MKNTVLFLFLLLPLLGFSQIKNGTIIYKIDMNNYLEYVKKKESYKKPQVKMYYTKAFNAAKNLKFRLTFNKQMSVYEKMEVLEVGEDDKFTGLALILSPHKGTYYTDIVNKKELVLTNAGIYLTPEKENNHWELTNETKQIGQFKCYKATFKKMVPAGEKTITAWYAPELPFSYGPNNRGGQLPGVILELHDELGTSYYASEITLNTSLKTKLQWPKEANVMSAQEYKKKGDEFYSRIKNRKN